MASRTIGCSLILILLVSMSSLVSSNGFAQNPYTVCIGDRCDYPSYINLNCSFATSHRDDADEQAAKLVCMVRNSYEKYTYVRTGAIKGGRCGATYIQVRCQ